MLQAFLPSMIAKNHGHVVAMSSIAGLIGLPNIVPYSASKFAVRGEYNFFFYFSFSSRTQRIKTETVTELPWIFANFLCANCEFS